jgi:hypothetical protein
MCVLGCSALSLLCSAVVVARQPLKENVDMAIVKNIPAEVRNAKQGSCNGVSLEVEIAHDLEAGRPMQLFARLTNDGNEEAEYFSSVALCYLDVIVVDQLGHPAALTDKGESLLRRDNPGPVFISRSLRRLAPGKSRQWSCDIEPIFRLPPKSYSLSVRFSTRKPPKTKIELSGLKFVVK